MPSPCGFQPCLPLHCNISVILVASAFKCYAYLIPFVAPTPFTPLPSPFSTHTPQVALWKRVEGVFGRTGIPSFLLEGVLGELQAATSRHPAHLTLHHAYVGTNFQMLCTP